MVFSNDQIAQHIQKNNINLLGQIEVTDDEYRELISYASAKINNLDTHTFVEPDLVLALALVQVAIRRYKDGKFWPCFTEELGYDVHTDVLQYIGFTFYKTIISYDELICIQSDNGNRQYVENIKTHAFVTDGYMQGFFDFSYAYYEKNLFRQISSGIEEDFEDLSSFMKTTLNNKNDKIVEHDSKKATKSYRLLKSTRTAFAFCNAETISELFLPILSLIDKYFYDNIIPKFPNNRFEKGFVEWCATQDSKENSKKEHDKKSRKSYSHRPFISVDIDKETVQLIVPPQKFRSEDCKGIVKVFVEINGCAEVFDLEVYTSFGIYITEEKSIPIPTSFVFDSINITVKAISEKKHRIPESNYRIFNRDWENISRFEKGPNYILVKPKLPTSWKNKQDQLDYSDGYDEWQYFSAIITEDSIFYVGNKPISVIGEFSSEPVFERKVNHFQAFDENQKEITIAREHPSISFVVERDKINGSVLIVNDSKYPLAQIKDKVCYEWPDDKRCLAVNLSLNSILSIEDNAFFVTLDVPGVENKKKCEYLLLSKFNCHFNKPRYTYDKEAILKITKGDCIFDILDESWIVKYENKETIIYSIPLDANPTEAQLTLYMYKQYKITMPIKMFLYGFSEKSMQSQSKDYIWYTQLQENLYVTIPGAKNASAYYGKNDSEKVQGIKIDGSTFRIDISEFVRFIRENEKITYHYINLEYEDNAIRKLSLPVVCRTIRIDPYFKVFVDDGIPYIDVVIKGDSKVYLKAEDSSGNIVFDRKPIVSGKNNLPELSEKEFYNFYPYTEDAGRFSFNAKRTPLKEQKNVGCINLDDLTNCELIVQSLISNEEELTLNREYHLNLIKKENDISHNGSVKYTGYMFADKIEKILPNGKVCYIKDANGKCDRKKLGKILVFVTRLENDLHLSIQTYSYQDEDWRSIYYDRDSKELIHFDDPLLDTNDQGNRFLFLDEYDTDTTFIINTTRIKKHKENQNAVQTV